MKHFTLRSLSLETARVFGTLLCPAYDAGRAVGRELGLINEPGTRASYHLSPTKLGELIPLMVAAGSGALSIAPNAFLAETSLNGTALLMRNLIEQAEAGDPSLLEDCTLTIDGEGRLLWVFARWPFSARSEVSPFRPFPPKPQPSSRRCSIR